ncbi:SPOR domain-containing protein [Oceanobacillus halotolerans]|uniref:SPOR domain-containing protein n=1 Tax=Oceanobacillus halotolerans TaxID=2663380 RepID=UPI0013DA8C8A|nr:SPOR domain-containing protein [Oceanobacillus halotolerans]
MENKRSITVKLNKKKSTKQSSESAETSGATNPEELHDEMAAAVEGSDDKMDIPAYARQHDPDDIHRGLQKKKKGFKNLKPILFAILSAIGVGSILGFIMLNFFGGMDDYTGTGDTNSSVPAVIDDEGDDDSHQTTEEDEPQVTANSSASLPALTGFVVQAGVFSDEPNAEEAAKDLENSGYSSVVWNDGESYFLFTGVASTKEHANELAATIDEEVYVKEWQTDEVELTLNEKEAQWIHNVSDQWKASLKSVSQNGSLQTEGWNKVLEAFPTESETLSPLHNTLKELNKEMEAADENRAHYLLLQIWYELEEQVL